ncbi:hypothetical protein LTR62_001328 [Meristemomyces frigidus]|uniref:Uncharacterized protein n=1 Tax=Meristemomyces frigidus TaxID=1508187 RepID=A0AAN7YMG2_9PEZI|nr:hypothetical protein LTR62_001328 [Meristemomyces frigidus]
MPVFQIVDQTNINRYVSYNYLGGPNNTIHFAMHGFTSTSPSSKRDEYYNEEHFTSGGLESGASYNQEYDGGYLTPSNDFGTVEHQVSCHIGGDLSANEYEFQIYDNNHQGTIAGGRLRAFQYDPYDQNQIDSNINSPLPLNTNCEVA